MEKKEIKDEDDEEEEGISDINKQEITIVDENLDFKKMLYEVVTSQQEQISKLTDVVSKNSQQMVDTQKQIIVSEDNVERIRL